MNTYIQHDIKFNRWWLYFKMYEIPMFFVQSAPTMFRVACRGCHYRFTELNIQVSVNSTSAKICTLLTPTLSDKQIVQMQFIPEKCQNNVPNCAKLISSFLQQADIPWLSRVPLGDSHHWAEKLLLKCLLVMLGTIWRTVAVWFNNNYPNVSKRC